MKKRSMILALASMLGISAAATAVSGFAWFTTQTTASIDGGSYSVGAANGDLTIAKVDADTNCTSAKTASKNEIKVTPTASTAFADVSSVDGKNFYKLKNMDLSKNTADFVVEDTKTTDAETKKTTWMSEVNTSQMVCVSWSVSVSNGSNTPAMDVYISHEGALFTDAQNPTNDEKSYVDCYRLAVFEVTSSPAAENLVFMYANSNTGLIAADETSSTVHTYNYTVAGDWDGTGEIAASATKTTMKQILNTATIPSGQAQQASTASSQCLITGLTNTAKTLKFVVWCEGTDTPEEAINTANSVSLAFDLVGLTA